MEEVCMPEYFELVRREKFKRGSWQAKSWKCATENIDWSTPGLIKSHAAKKKRIKRVVIAYKSYIRYSSGSKKIIGKLRTKRAMNFHCFADTEKELSDLLDEVKNLERAANSANEKYSGKLKHILKCMVIYDNRWADCIISLDELYKYFGR